MVPDCEPGWPLTDDVPDRRNHRLAKFIYSDWIPVTVTRMVPARLDRRLPRRSEAESPCRLRSRTRRIGTLLSQVCPIHDSQNWVRLRLGHLCWQWPSARPGAAGRHGFFHTFSDTRFAQHLTNGM